MGLVLDDFEKQRAVQPSTNLEYYLDLRMESNSEIKEQLESSGVDQQDLPLEEFSTLKDEVSMLKDKIAHLQSQLEESENEAIMAAEIGQQLLEQKSSLEALREQERNNFTTKLEVFGNFLTIFPLKISGMLNHTA